MKLRRTLLALAASLTLTTSALAAPQPVTPASILTAAPAGDWAVLDPKDLLVIDLEDGRRAVILLAENFAPIHVANIRTLARAHWYDGLFIERVQDNYVVQWGDPDGGKPLPPGIVEPAPAEYDRAARGFGFRALPYPDTYARRVGFAGALPVAEGARRAWLTHCYGMVGVGRDVNPDTGTGAELYAVIGQPPRALDRNIAVVGRVLAGMDWMAALPRGTAELGFYADPRQRLRIARVRVGSDLPAAEQPRFEVLDVTSPSFESWLRVKANRRDSFFLRPANALDVCNALPPVRGAGRVGM